jgi:hypothetical protein
MRGGAGPCIGCRGLDIRRVVYAIRRHARAFCYNSHVHRHFPALSTTTAAAAATFLATLSGPAPSLGAPAPSATGELGPGGGLSAVGVRIEAGRLHVRACTTLPCTAAVGSDGLPVALAGELDVSKARFQPVPLGPARRLLHVWVPSTSRPGVAFEALVAGGGADGTDARVVWSSPTGFGSTGEGSGGRLRLEGGAPYVGTLRRELTLCGLEETLLEPKRIDPGTLQLHRVAMHRLPQGVRDAAPTLLAAPALDAPLGSILSVRGASVNDGASLALADEDDSTAWHETLKGDGKGEFVVFSAPRSLPIERLSLRVRPRATLGAFDHPVSLWLTVDDATYRIAIPKGAAERVDVPLPKPIATTCLALSIDRGEARADGVDANIGLVEVDAVPAIPKTGHSLEDLVTLLDLGGPDADLAATLLEHAGARGAGAIERRLASLAEPGRARAVEVLEGTPCAAAAPALTTLSWDAPKPVVRRARAALDACGAAAAPALGAAFARGPDAAREILAERWARLDPKNALPGLLDLVRAASANRRRTYRVALARVPDTEAGRAAVDAWLKAAPLPAGGEVDPVIELGRAVAWSAEVAPLEASLAKALLAHAGEDAAFERRWLAAEPLAALAARGNATALAWLRGLHASPDRYLRARAAEVSGEVDALRPEVVRALSDPAPRVRLSALLSLRKGQGPTGATGPVMTLLKDDGWTFVRAAAAETLGESKGGGDVDLALGQATLDDLPSVRAAAIRALVTRGARSQLPAIRKRAFDRGELVDVRGEAIAALGSLCDQGSVDDLFDLVKRGSGSDGAHHLALSAILALGDIHPVDLPQRLAAIDQTSLVVKDAVRRALQAKSQCK